MSQPLYTHKILPAFFEPRADTAVAWLGMAGVLINARGTLLLIDPLLSTQTVNGEALCEGHYRLRVPLPLEVSDLPRLDAVLYTHADDDHLGRLTAQRLAEQTGCRFIAPPPVQKALGVDAQRLTVARDFDRLSLGAAEIIITPALHNWQAQESWQRGDCCGYLISTPDGTVWHPGDTRLIPELLTFKNVDVLFFDVAAVAAHLGPEGSAQLAQSSGAKVMVAYHYGTFDLPPGSWGNSDPADSLPYVAGLAAKFLQLPPGEVLTLPLEG